MPWALHPLDVGTEEHCSLFYFLTEVFKQPGVERPEFDIIYYLYGFILHIFQASFHHFSKCLLEEHALTVLIRWYYSFNMGYPALFSITCTHIDMLLPTDFMFGIAGFFYLVHHLVFERTHCTFFIVHFPIKSH